jgi:hypothetical protein
MSQLIIASEQTDRRLLRLAPDDNVGVVAATIEAGQTLLLAGRPLRFLDRVPLGQKVALVPIAAGEKVRKYGAPIGSAKEPIQPGQHVHTHNLQSDYLPTYTRDVPSSQ